MHQWAKKKRPYAAAHLLPETALADTPPGNFFIRLIIIALLTYHQRVEANMLVTILVILLILFLVGALPNWGYHNYGWGPSGGLGLVLVIVLILVLLGRI
jgi:Na+/citrate or Na+/malate symporter